MILLTDSSLSPISHSRVMTLCPGIGGSGRASPSRLSAAITKDSGMPTTIVTILAIVMKLGLSLDGQSASYVDRRRQFQSS